MNLRRQTLHCFQKTNLKCKDTKKWKVKELREIYHIKKKKKKLTKEKQRQHY